MSSVMRAFGRAVGDALGQAHAQNLVHYDLTPENIHLGQGRAITVKIRELTILATRFDRPWRLRRSSSGSAIWMAPVEQFDLGFASSARRQTSGRSRLLAVLCGDRRASLLGEGGGTIRRPRRPNLLREILGGSDRPRFQARQGALGCTRALPEWFDKWFARCVVREPDKRFSNAHSVAQSLPRREAWRPRQAPADADDQQTTMRLPDRPPWATRGKAVACLVEYSSRPRADPQSPRRLRLQLLQRWTTWGRKAAWRRQVALPRGSWRGMWRWRYGFGRGATCASRRPARAAPGRADLAGKPPFALLRVRPAGGDRYHYRIGSRRGSGSAGPEPAAPSVTALVRTFDIGSAPAGL